MNDHREKAWAIAADAGFAGGAYHWHRIANDITAAITAAVEAERARIAPVMAMAQKARQYHAGLDAALNAYERSNAIDIAARKEGVR